MWKFYTDYIREYMGFVKEGSTYFTYYFRPRRAPLKKFLIFTIGRSGSNLLISLLNSLPAVHCRSELLGRRVVNPYKYLECNELLSKQDIYGFKLNTYHFEVQNIWEPTKFVEVLYKAGYRIIDLKRRNILRQSLSHLYALYRYKFHHKKSQGEQKLTKMIVDFEELDQDLRFFEKNNEIEDQIISGFPHLKLYYEDDLQDDRRHQFTVDRVLEYLDIPSTQVNTDLVKTTPVDLSSFIENYDELEEFVKGTRYELFLDDQSI